MCKNMTMRQFLLAEAVAGAAVASGGEVGRTRRFALANISDNRRPP
ncbi:hypothetical protein BN439_1410 [Erwinia amylovora Ea644]|nr:hypothetical protein BN439_1410 [Erwinia amylovora Ea644]CCP06496.1 hypothetical protein BN440_1454 [Erwinia amylovora MR1]